MADSFSTNLNLTKPEVGSSTDTWGTKLNTQVIDPIDAIFSATGTEVNVRFNSANFDDNKKALFGTGDDLEIYHDGSNSYISDVGTGSLYIRGSNAVALQNGTGETYIQGTSDGAVAINHDNAQKFVTTSSGISINGDIAVTGNVDGVDVASIGSTVAGLSTVATSGAYSDLSGLPTIPTNNNQLTNGSGFTTYTSNQATDTTANPTFRGVNISANYDLTLNPGNWTGEKTGKIQRHSNHMYFQTHNSGLFIFRNQSGVENTTISAGGGIATTGNVTAYSDIRLKKDVKTIENALDKVCKLRGVEYTRISNDEREIGVIAQEVKEVVPELVEIKDNSDSFGEGMADAHIMKYQNTVGLLIEAIKELKTELNELKG